MGPDVVSDLVLAGDDGADQIRVADGGPAHREERRPYPSSGQVVEDPRCELRVRSVVEADRRVRVDGFGGPDHLPDAEAPWLAVGASGACVLPGPVAARRGRVRRGGRALEADRAECDTRRARARAEEQSSSRHHGRVPDTAQRAQWSVTAPVSPSTCERAGIDAAIELNPRML